MSIVRTVAEPSGEEQTIIDTVIRRIGAATDTYGAPRILIAIPSRTEIETAGSNLGGNIPKVLADIQLPQPSTIAVASFVEPEANIGQIRQAIVEHAIEHDFRWLVMVDDDVFAPSHTLLRLLELAREHDERAFVAAHYNRRGSKFPYPAASKWQHGEIVPITVDGSVQDCCILALGWSVLPVSALKAMGTPWFAMGEKFSEDYFFAIRANECGFKMLTDSSLQCRHVDRTDGTEY